MSRQKKKSLEDKKKEERNKRLWKTYGLTAEDAEQMLVEQGNGCWICGREDGRLCVDHVHVKGYKKLEPEKRRKYVRGMLCFMCNTALKGFEKTADGERNRKQLEGTYIYFKTYPLKGEI